MMFVLNRTLKISVLQELAIFRIDYLYKFRKYYGNYAKVVPGNVSATLTVPDNIETPVIKDVPSAQIRTINNLVRIRECCQTARKILDFATQLVKVNVTTDEIDKAVHSRCLDLRVYPSPLGYKSFPKSICTSVNNVICHGIPDDRPLQDGDIINLDVTVFQNGFHGDCSRTVLVGSVDDAGVALVEATEACLQAGVDVCGDGVPLSHIGDVIEQEAAARGFLVVPYVAGHGVGRQFHEPPDIYHFSGAPDCGVMKAGMTFTIEPALTEGGVEMVILEDGWTAVTADGSRSAQAEHTILITQAGAEILTLGDLLKVEIYRMRVVTAIVKMN